MTAMTALTQTPVNKGAVPVVFKAAGAWCFGWFHAASLPKRRVGVVMCRPMGYEANCTYRTYTQLAKNLSNAGFDVLRFDYHGTGDSAGKDTDPDRVQAWIDSTTSAANELKRLGNISHLALFGVRLGATFAALAASRLGGVESLVLWAPCVTGRAFARELRAVSNTVKSNQPCDEAAPRDIEALGYIYTAQTLQDLDTLDCQRPDVPPAKRVMIIGRDDLPGEGPLPAKYNAMGIDTTYSTLPGYCAMMVEPHESTLEHTTLGLITDWLAAVPPPQTVLLDDCQKEAFSPVEAVVDKVREVCYSFGPEQSLFGILAEPIELSPQNSRSETVILMLNVGANHRIGPNRLYVQMARSWAASGYRAFRFDLTGIGDSFAKEGFSNRNLYEKDSTPDVRFAIDYLVAKGFKKIVLTGICSGAFVAFQTALVDPRVTVQILMNPRLLEYQVEKEKDTLQSAMQSYYKSTHFYQRELLNPKVYRRLLRGEVDVNGIAKRFQIVFKARLKRVFNGLLKSAPDDLSVLAQVKQLSARGTNTLLIMATQDDGRDYIDIQLGSQCSYMQGSPNFGMVLVENTDHTFSTSISRQFVIATVHQHLEKLLSSEDLNMVVPAANASPAAALAFKGKELELELELERDSK